MAKKKKRVKKHKKSVRKKRITKKKKFFDENFFKSLDVLKRLFNERHKLPEIHVHRHKPIVQQLLNCSEILIRRGFHNVNIKQHYLILKEIEDMDFKECKNGFEVEVDKKITCYDFEDAYKYYKYLKGKFGLKKARKKECRIKREPGYLYFVDKEGGISKVKVGGKRKVKVCRNCVKKKPGCLYYINKKGTISSVRRKK